MKSNAVSESGPRSRWAWWIGILVAVLAFASGAVGLWQYDVEYGGQPDALSIIYHTAQLFILHAPHLEHPAPPLLHLGRILAAGLFLFAAGKASFKVFRDEIRTLRLWLPWRPGHVVICGLGDLGMRLALDARNRGKFVVAIDSDPAPGTLERARGSGVLVLRGDARDPALLHRSRIGCAEFLVAACGDDQSNVAIAAVAGQFAQPNKTRATPLVCRLLIQDPNLRAMLGKEAFFPHTGRSYRVNFSDLDLEDTAARQALRRYPLDFETIRETDNTLVHLVVIGFGQVGQSVALHAARVGHFANEVGKHGKRLRITVADQKRGGWDSFAGRYPNLRLVCDAGFAQHDIKGSDLIAAMAAFCSSGGADNVLVTYVVSIESDDAANLHLGLALSKHISNCPAQVLIHQSTRRGFAALFPREGRGSGLGSRVHAFGMQEDVFTWDVLLRESEDKVAQAIHEDYQTRSGGKGVHEEWNELGEPYKESNRQAADHIPIKLRALGLHDAPFDQRNERIEKFNEGQMELLARIEHARWCAERYLAGWRYGKPTDRERRINECLVPWNQLEEKMKQKDCNQIEAIPAILQSVGRGIYR